MFNFIRVLKSDVSFVHAVSMAMRRTLNSNVVKALQIAKANHLPITPVQVEVHYLAGGAILDLVEGCANLEREQVIYDINELFLVDLSKGEIGKFIQAFLVIRQTYKDLSLKEFTKRYILGEDVIGKSIRNEFLPWKTTKSWLVRMNFGQLDQDEISRLRSVNPSGALEFYDPSLDKWIEQDEEQF